MGSKKHHKKESKKKKHRSRSRSPIDGEERERKRHKKHKDRKKDRSPDVEEVPVDSHLAHVSPPSPGQQAGQFPGLQAGQHEAPEPRERSHSRERRMRELHRHDKEKEERERGRGEGGAGAGGGGPQESLSVEESNRLRAKLGLKPLQLNEAPAEDGKLKDDLGEFYHVPAANLAQQHKSDKIRQKLLERKEKRTIEEKLKTKTLGEESDSEDTAAWVQRERVRDKQKQEAARRAAVLDEMDAVFGVSALVEAEHAEQRERAYTARNLRGLRVAHDVTSLGEERETILTLADAGVLADDAQDVLVNVNLLDDERYKKNIEERKKARAGYQAYDDEEELEAAALGFQKPVLAKYDDEIEPARASTRRGFTIGDEPAVDAKHSRDMMRGAGAWGAVGVERRLESLQLPALRPARDYLDEHEIQATFKKPKKKGKMRRAAKREPIDVEQYDAGGAPLHTDDTEVETGGLVQDAEETEPDTELQAALARARRLRQQDVKQERKVAKVEDILSQVKEEPAEEEAGAGGAASAGGGGGGMVLDATAEFCRTLGDIPTYGQAGNRDQQDEIMDFEAADADIEPTGASGAGGAWSRVEPGSEPPAALQAGPGALGAEPRLGAGVAGALQLALSKGYLERAGAAPAPRSQHLHLLQARHYSIEDKTYTGEDDKYGRRERGYSGPLTDFREKGGFRPNIKLEYVDDEGRPLCPKEAFRYLSHKFHGKGPGKNKQEKRIKKQVQEGLMKKMSSTDTPLNTLQMLQDKQRETHSPYIVLSGAKRDSAT